LSARLAPRTRSGTTLVEIVIALGLLAGLLLSVAGLLAAGNRQIRSGARASRALALARTVVEDLDLGARHRAYQRLGCAGGQRACHVDSGQPAVRRWHALAGSELTALRIEVRVEALGAATLDAAPALRVSVRVAWQEGLRSRGIRLTTLRV
jgi:Tfp pilus assembly protein PilV